MENAQHSLDDRVNSYEHTSIYVVINNIIVFNFSLKPTILVSLFD